MLYPAELPVLKPIALRRMAGGRIEPPQKRIF
ncbi:protein of unknown function [Candidatus Filomicrobium marinum]|uniref:Uncharacterized protein n=1 Tax=Candidatus Filomicrobium marinum TaxID=1608628 RepID=A0A0D6JBY1_9HYPH|nr:protein of unknown function [Candidatus Filomicrobium marinum]CPR16797.1 protein of unknown function [Candidatus Filomicrobium marinum]